MLQLIEGQGVAGVMGCPRWSRTVVVYDRVVAEARLRLAAAGPQTLIPAGARRSIRTALVPKIEPPADATTLTLASTAIVLSTVTAADIMSTDGKIVTPLGGAPVSVQLVSRKSGIGLPYWSITDAVSVAERLATRFVAAEGRSMNDAPLTMTFAACGGGGGGGSGAHTPPGELAGQNVISRK